MHLMEKLGDFFFFTDLLFFGAGDKANSLHAHICVHLYRNKDLKNRTYTDKYVAQQ